MNGVSETRPAGGRRAGDRDPSAAMLDRRRGGPFAAGLTALRTAAARRRAGAPPTAVISGPALLHALRRRWRSALALGLPLALAAALVAWCVLPANYTAYALLRISAVPEVLVFNTSEATADFQTYRKTQIGLITSRFTLAAALRKPEAAALSIVQEQPFPLHWLEQELQVDSHHSPEILKLSLTGDRPAELAVLVNAVKDAYLEEVVNAERTQRAARLKALEETWDQTQQKVKAKQARIESLARQLGTGDPQALTVKQQMAIEYFAKLKQEHARVRFELMRAQVDATSDDAPDGSASEGGDAATAADVKAEVPSGGASTGRDPVAQDPRALLAARRIIQLQALIARYEGQVADREHPVLREYRSELAELEKIAARHSGTASRTAPQLDPVEMLSRQEKLLRDEVEQYAAFVDNVGTSSFELEAMRAEIEQFTSISDRVAREMETLRIELDGSPQRVRLIHAAEVPQQRDTARQRKLTGAAGLGAFALAIAAVSLLEVRHHRVTSPADLTAELGLPLIGSLPAMPARLWRPAGRSAEARADAWNAALLEAVDGIRTLLLRHAGHGRPTTLMIASAGEGDGRTTLACQLAASLARAGRRTVLVDADLRRPTAHELLGTPLEPGLSECLSGGLWLQNAVHASDVPSLWSVPAGRPDEASLQAVARDGARGVLEALRQEYDFVVVDTPPLLTAADAGAIGQNVDAVLLAVRRDVSRLPAVVASCEKLEMLAVPVWGAVLVGSRFDASAPGQRDQCPIGCKQEG